MFEQQSPHQTGDSVGHRLAAPAVGVEAGAALLDGAEVGDLFQAKQPVVAVPFSLPLVPQGADQMQDASPELEDDKQGVLG